MLAVGKYADAAKAARAALEKRPKDLVARTVLARTLEERGKRKEALVEYDKVVEVYNKGDARRRRDPLRGRSGDPRDVAVPEPGRRHAAGRAQPACQAPEEESRRTSTPSCSWPRPGARTGGASAQAKANKYVKQIITQNTEIPEARVLRAKTALMFYNQGAALKDLERAHSAPTRSSCPALTLKAAIHIGNGDYDNAKKHLDKAIEVNPNQQGGTRSVLAAFHYIRGDRDGVREAAQGRARLRPDLRRLLPHVRRS